MRRFRSHPARMLAVATVTAAAASAPAQARLDEGGSGVRAPATQVRVETFDWSDAAVGGGIGAAAGLVAVGTALVVRRRGTAPEELAGPAAR